MTRKHALALAAGLSLTAAACADTPEPTAPQAAAPAAPNVQLNLDPSAAYAREIPGFGGVFFDEEGTPNVYLTSPAQRGTAERVLANLTREHGSAPEEIQVLQADYDFAQLSEYLEKANGVLSSAGVVFTDLDETTNRVKVGVENRGLETAIRTQLKKLGVPDEAVIVEETEPIELAATLRDVVRPIRSGLQINFGGYVCTLGFNASHSGGLSFVTNSHCTNTQGGVESTRYYQPSSSSSSQIATEVSDPTYTTGGSCPLNRRCRRSDSSRALYLGGISLERGRIARTTSRGTGSGSITISSTTPYFNITGEGSAAVGTQVNKIGRTTGWTYGNVSSTCVNVNVSGTNITQLCQNIVSAGVGSGDSGSPVFTWSGSGSNVTLVGLLWGGSGSTFVYSPLSNVEAELGSLTTIF